MKKVIYCTLLAIGLSAPACSFSVEDERFFDTLDFEDPLLAELNQLSDAMPSSDMMGLRTVPISEILSLIEEVNGLALIDQQFFLRTNPLVVRDILDYPLWEMHSFQEPEEWIVGGHLFWNFMQRAVFTCTNTNISSYLDFNKDTLFNALDNISETLKPLYPDADEIEQLFSAASFQKNLTLFKNFTVEQRRIGIMFHAWKQWQRAEIRMLWPFYYVESNFFATPAEKRAIDNEFGAFSPDEFRAFKKNHGISDKIGFGDFRFEANYAAYASDTSALRLGGFVTLPVSFALANGVQGTSFDTNVSQPTFSLQKILDILTNDTEIATPSEKAAFKEALIGDICKNKNGFLLGVLDRLSAMIVQTNLGNKRHLGLGFVLRSRTSLRALLEEWSWSDNISWNNRCAIEYLAPAEETRFYARNIPSSAFAALDLGSTDPEVQKKTLAFIDKAIVDKFYPYAVHTRVYPGLIFKWFSRWNINGEVWDISIGSDFWLQRGEQLKHLTCVDQSVLPELDREHAKTGMAYQFKSVGGLGLKMIRPDYALFFSINAEGTSWKKGIGDDWTVSLNLEASF